MRTRYNKLVRDRIPEIIREDGGTPVTSTLSRTDVANHLRLKLLEEVHELFLSKDRDGFLRETADVVEVLSALASEYDVTWEEIEDRRHELVTQKGGFGEGVFLHAVYDGPALEASESVDSVTPCLLVSGSSPSLRDVLRRELDNSRTCKIATAFCTRAMLNLLSRPFEDFLARGGQLFLLTSVMNNFNNPDDLLHLRNELPACNLRVYYPGNGHGPERFAAPPSPFHLKCFLFEKLDGRNSLIVGSSNLTGGGLARNEEWNLYSNSEVNLPFPPGAVRTIYDTAEERFDCYWEHDSVDITDALVSAYRPRWERTRTAGEALREQIESTQDSPPHPRPAQKTALEALAAHRRLGTRKCAVIAATGLGKTHLAGFDFRQSDMQNLLFVAHRERILRDARDVFRGVLRDPAFGVMLSGQSDEAERHSAMRGGSSVFAMIQTLSRRKVLERFARQHFDYIVVDEFHHGEAATYRAVLEHFQPRFLLGLTATPERMDGRDVLRLCDYNIAYEARVFEAIDQGWLVPFQYFAVHDPTDYSQIRWTGIGYDEEELEVHLSTDTRAELITRNIKRFLPASGKVKALAFCANRGHARYMTGQFNRRGLVAACLLGDSSDDARAKAIQKLQDEADPLQVICSVDIFGEGVDIPAVSHVLLLRPTLSFTVFLQQLGRGLRKAAGKEYLVALDFVGNFRNSYIVPLVFRGCASPQDAREKGKDAELHLPAGCAIDVDAQVKRIWDDEIRRTLAPRNRRELLRQTYAQMRKDLGRVPTLLDFIANPDACDPHAFVKHYKNWLRAKEDAGDLNEHERQLVGTTAEGFLQHVEKELNAVRSYKMVVLLVLLKSESTATKWNVDWIADGFRRHYLDNLVLLPDCSPLANASNPEDVPLSKIRSLLKSMPLRYLSNTEGDYFIFDRESGVFSLKPEVCVFWKDSRFRNLLNERVLYALARYFNSKGIDLTKYGFDIDTYRRTEDASCKVRTGEPKTTLPFYPTLQVAAGVFREGASEYENLTRDVSDPQQRFYPDRHFVAPVHGDSMDGGQTPIHDRELVILERFDATRAGSLTSERALAVEFHDDFGDTSYALKQIVKDAAGTYWLHSWNKKYKDKRIDPDNTFPFARYVCTLRE